MKTGRNDPCPCGSGLKYKKCCLAADEARELPQQQAQQRLRAEGDEDPLDGDEDDLDDDWVDDVRPFDVTSIERVTYARGFARDFAQACSGETLETTVWTAPDIPAAILECLDREAVVELEGEWGDTRSATPIQVEELDLETADDVIGLQVYNRAALLLSDNTEETRRLHRICQVLEQAAAEPGAERLPPGTLRAADAPEPRPGRAPVESRITVDWEALLKEHRNQGGTCELCGASLTRRGAARHLDGCAPGHYKARSPERAIVRVRVTAPGAPAYWLDLEARADAKLDALDGFLRTIWLECCGHLSKFSTNDADYLSVGYEFGLGSPFGGFSFGLGSRFGRARAERRMTARIGDVLPVKGKAIEYEYDFGSTTALRIAVTDGRVGRIGHRAVRLAARNTPPRWPCEVCGEPAAWVCAACFGTERYGGACDTHRDSHACRDESYLPVVNSPRMGVCGYTGKVDEY